LRSRLYESSLEGNKVESNLKHRKLQEGLIQTKINDSSITKEGNIDSTGLENLRYLIFGTSVSWGAGLENRNTAYPYLLSKNVKNLALRACGPNYPSVCTESMVGEDVYDVIVLEYMTGSQDGLYPLARRLRKRFPEAKIIFLSLWYPLMLKYEDGERVSVSKWMSREGFKREDEAMPEIVTALNKSSFPWSLDFEFLAKKAQYVQEIAKEVSGYLYFGPNKWNNPDEIPQHFDSVKMVTDNYKLFNKDWLHLSPEGHLLVAKNIHKILLDIKAGPSDKTDSWGNGDSCYSWYENGDDIIKHDENVYMENFQKTSNSKFSLTFSKEGGSLTVHNPFNEPRPLLLSFMTTGPESTIYPTAEVYIYNLKAGFLSDTIYIYPIANEYPHPVHVVQTKKISVAPPGDNKLAFNFVNENVAPFRVVAVSITDGDIIPSKNFQGPASLI